LTGEELCDKSGVRLNRFRPEELILSENKFGARMSEGSIIKEVMRAVLIKSSHEKVSADLSFF
jgi:hypothetical protein